MFAPLAKLIDWSAIQVLSRRMPPAHRGRSRLKEALELLNRPDFVPAESQPAQLEFAPAPNESGHFRFPTPRPSEWAENNVVHGRLYRCAKHWQQRPALILLHGWNSHLSYRFRFPRIARGCNRAGFNVATIVLPYHFQRRPAAPEALAGLDYLRVAERTAQAVAEIRALADWLLSESCPAVALWGSSYGGWLAGLTACHEPRLAAVVMAVPGVRSNRSRAQLVVWPRVRQAMLQQDPALQKLNASPLNLLSNQPAISSHNILLIAAIHDLLAPIAPIEELWQAWGRPEIWRLPHGHFSFSLLRAPALMTNRVLRWLAPRLETPSFQPAMPPLPGSRVLNRKSQTNLRLET